MKNAYITKSEALENALASAGLTREECRCPVNRLENEFYYITVYTLFQKYEFYVDALTGEVPGMSSEPMLSPDAPLLIRTRHFTKAAA